MNKNLRTFVVVNPASASGATGRRWDRIARALGREVGPFEHAMTEGPRHATALTRKALANGFEMVVAVGGDGTLNEVACGFFDEGRPVAPSAVLGVIPQGTGSDFPRGFGIGRTIEEACARLSGFNARMIDVGHVRFTGHEGRSGERVFVNVASFGCGGAVAHAVTSVSKRMGGRLAFLLTTARTLLRYQDQAVTLTVGNGAPESMTITNCAVCNSQYFGGGMWVAPYADIDDGRFDITIWTGFSLKDFILKWRSLYDGTHVYDPGTRLLLGKKVVATSNEDVLLDVDGECVGRLPATIEILPAALRFKI